MNHLLALLKPWYSLLAALDQLPPNTQWREGAWLKTSSVRPMILEHRAQQSVQVMACTIQAKRMGCPPRVQTGATNWIMMNYGWLWRSIPMNGSFVMVNDGLFTMINFIRINRYYLHGVSNCDIFDKHQRWCSRHPRFSSPSVPTSDVLRAKESDGE